MSEYMYAGIPVTANKEQRHCIIAIVIISGQRTTKGDREYSFAIVSIYRFRVLDDNRSLILDCLSNSCGAFITIPSVIL